MPSQETSHMRSVLLLKGKRGLASWKSPRKTFLNHFNILPLFRQPSLSASDELATHSFSLGMILEGVEGYCKKKSKPLSLEWPGRWGLPGSAKSAARWGGSGPN